MLAISTSWNSHHHSAVTDMLSEIKDAGFNAIEAGYNLTEEKLEDLISLVDVLGIKVASVHNFCPLPPELKSQRHVSDRYRISSLDEEERKRAVEYTKRTLDTAKRLSAESVVIHAGTVELEENYTANLMGLFNKGKTDSEDYKELKQRFLDDRDKRKEPYLRAVTKSLEEILPYAHKYGIKIAIENRYSPEEIPNFEEIKYFLELFNKGGLFYWHDVGHAEVNEKLGISSHLALLSEFSEYMLGMHLHDIKGLGDHRAPFSGEFDFSKITPYLSDDLINVIEVNSRATCAEIKDSLEKLEALFVRK